MERLVTQPWRLSWLFDFHRGLLTCPIWGLSKLVTGAWRGSGLWGLGRYLRPSGAEHTRKIHHYAIVNSNITESELSVLRGGDGFVSLPNPTGRKVCSIPIPGSTFVNRDALAKVPGHHLNTYDAATHNSGSRYHHNQRNRGVPAYSKRKGDEVYEAELTLKLKVIEASRDTSHRSKFNVAFLPPQSAREYHLQREHGSIMINTPYMPPPSAPSRSPTSAPSRSPSLTSSPSSPPSSPLPPP